MQSMILGNNPLRLTFYCAFHMVQTYEFFFENFIGGRRSFSIC